MKLKVAFLDCVSHGDCAVITFTEKRRKACMVVDGGKTSASATALADYLKAEKIKKINLLVITHHDQDHIGGMLRFVKNQIALADRGKKFVRIMEYWGPMPSQERIPGYNPTAKYSSVDRTDAASWRQFIMLSLGENNKLFDLIDGLGVPIRHPSLADRPRNPFSSVKIDLIGPDIQIPGDQIKRKAFGATTRVSKGLPPIKTLDQLKEAISGNAQAMATEAKRYANNQSIVFRLRLARGSRKAKAWTFLFAGDSEQGAWDVMLSDKQVARKLPARVLKVSHHGSVNGITLKGVRKVKPVYSIISTGQEHGIPDEPVLGFLQKVKSDILCTQRNSKKVGKGGKITSACVDVKKAVCPAYNNNQSIVFELDTRKGVCKVSPASRACLKNW